MTPASVRAPNSNLEPVLVGAPRSGRGCAQNPDGAASWGIETSSRRTSLAPEPRTIPRPNYNSMTGRDGLYDSDGQRGKFVDVALDEITLHYRADILRSA